MHHRHHALMGSRRRPLLALTGVFTLLAAAALIAPAIAPAEAGAPSGDGVQPKEVSGNPKCPEGLFELKVEPPVSSEKTMGALTVAIEVTGKLVDWTSNLGIDLVIVKGGDTSNFYEYEPEDTADTELHAPVNPNNNQYYGLSHVTFCYDFELEVEKDAETTFTRDYDWQIEKSNDAPEPIELAPGETYGVGYEVTAGVKGYEDSEWAVNGQITVFNPAPVAAEEVQVTDEITGGIVAGVNCGGEEEIPAESSLVCTYSSPLPNGETRTNTATATTSTSGIGSGSGTAEVVFGEPTELVDECVTVSDDNLEPAELGEVCVDESPQTFEYTKQFGPFPDECKTYEFANTASFVTNDNEETGEATSGIEIEVKCSEGGGCTLTQGYWKTHSKYGPAPYDATWALVGEDTPFFSTGLSWYELFWTPPKKGNAYVILAHQYMALVLNGFNGAYVPPEISEALADAEALLSDAGNDGKKGKAAQEMLALAEILAAYNEGLIGPGHCDEDGSSSL